MSLMQLRYVKTADGQAEIQGRSRPLARPVRNLLLVINDTQPVGYWLESVKGVTEDDLVTLEAEGLIEPVRGSSRAASAAKSARPASDPGPASVPPPAPAPTPSGFASSSYPSVLPSADGEGEWAAVQQAIQLASYPQLYDSLTSQGKTQLGLMRGFRFVLEVEKCNGLPELQAMAQLFITQLRDEQGMNAVRKFAEALRRQMG